MVKSGSRAGGFDRARGERSLIGDEELVIGEDGLAHLVGELVEVRGEELVGIVTVARLGQGGVEGALREIEDRVEGGQDRALGDDGETGQPRVSSRRSFEPTFAVASWRTPSCACTAPSAGSTDWFRSHASAAASARPAAGGA